MNTIPTVSFCLVLLYLTINPALAHNEEQEFIESCERTNHSYALTRDAYDAEGYANNFTEDGELHILGGVYKGRKAIADRLRSQRGSTFDRHLVSTIQITPTDDVNATGTVYVTVYQAPGGADDVLPKTSYLMRVIVYSDSYKMTSDGCKIASREGVLTFDQKISSSD